MGLINDLQQSAEQQRPAQLKRVQELLRIEHGTREQAAELTDLMGKLGLSLRDLQVHHQALLEADQAMTTLANSIGLEAEYAQSVADVNAAQVALTETPKQLQIAYDQAVIKSHALHDRYKAAMKARDRIRALKSAHPDFLSNLPD